jgi:hypothetical protein
MPIKPIPATSCNVFALTYCDRIEPAPTPIAEVKMSANAAPKKTVSLLVSLSAKQHGGKLRLIAELRNEH